MSYPAHLIKVNNRFYYKIKVPVDLRNYFSSTFIKKSFKTSDLREAKTMLAAMEYNIHRCFTLLRTGMLTDEVAQQLVSEIVPSKDKSIDNVSMKGVQYIGVKGNMALSEAIRQYVVEKEIEWTAKTKMEVSSVFRLLMDILGSINVAAITKNTVLELRSTLQKLPPNIYKKYPDKTIQEVLSCKDVEPMSIKSVNKHVARLGALLRYCVDEGMITTNPASGLKISEKKRADEERSAYCKADIKMLVEALPVNVDAPERYWIPLIGLYSGMRLNEICQLYVSDVINLNGQWCFSINNEKDKRLKNDASERVIPLHPVLEKLGFLKYVGNQRKNNVPRLWMNLSYCEINGYSNGFGKWYQRFNRLHVTDDPLKVFHSMRHTLTDALKQVGVIETVIAELVGHSNSGSMTMGRYGKRYQPKVLLDALVQLDYGVDIPEWK